MATASWIILAIGVALLAFSGWQLAGRSGNARAWLDSPRRRTVSNALFVWPPVGFLLTVFGLFPAVESVTVVAGLLGVLTLPAVIAFVWWGVLGFPFPLALVPGWARPEVARRRERARRAKDATS